MGKLAGLMGHQIATLLLSATVAPVSVVPSVALSQRLSLPAWTLGPGHPSATHATGGVVKAIDSTTMVISRRYRGDIIAVDGKANTFTVKASKPGRRPRAVAELSRPVTH